MSSAVSKLNLFFRFHRSTIHCVATSYLRLLFLRCYQSLRLFRSLLRQLITTRLVKNGFPFEQYSTGQQHFYIRLIKEDTSPSALKRVPPSSKEKLAIQATSSRVSSNQSCSRSIIFQKMARSEFVAVKDRLSQQEFSHLRIRKQISMLPMAMIK